MEYAINVVLLASSDDGIRVYRDGFGNQNEGGIELAMIYQIGQHQHIAGFKNRRKTEYHCRLWSVEQLAVSLFW